MALDDSSANEGSVVGLPVDYSKSSQSENSSAASSEEESSIDELTAAGDALCRSLLKEQQDSAHNSVNDLKSHEEKAAAAVVASAFSSQDNNNNNNNNKNGTTKIATERLGGTNTNNNDRGAPNLNLEPIDTTRGSTTNTTSEEPRVDRSHQSLDDRVHELETKLATLSRILQQQQRLSVHSLLTRSPSVSQRHLQTPTSSHQSQRTQLPHLPLMEGVPFQNTTNDENNNNSEDFRMTDSPPPAHPRISFQPYLESPAPIEDMSPTHRNRTMHQRKRLSFHLLYDGNEDNLARADDDNQTNYNATHHQNNHHPRNESMNENNNDNNNAQTTNNDIQNNNSNNHTIDQNDDEKLKREISDNSHNQNNTNNSKDDVHPLKNDNKNNNSSTSTTFQEVQSTNSTMTGNTSSKSNISEVAARVVNDAAAAKNIKLTRTTRSESMDASIASASSATMANSSSHRAGRTSRSNSITSEGSAAASPAGRLLLKGSVVGGIPPLLLSKDKRSKWLDHLNSFQESNHDVDLQMQEFIKVPGAVEKSLTSGFLICVDSFLYLCTILPIRFVWSCVLLSLHYFFTWTKRPPGKFQFHRRHTYQLIQVSIIFVVYRYILLPISIGKLYHWIRGQAMLKLYVLIAMAEIFDRLMCSLGQDCLDSLYWNTTRRPKSSRMLISIAIALVYTALHSLILFIHVATLNVAMNSADEALLALLIGGNFAEIKSTVFKKYNKPSLFKIFASDVTERFKLALFLGLVLLLNFCQGMDSRKMSDYQRIAGIVWMSECLSDWLKHSFITKFNFIPSSVYQEYGLLLAGDVTGIGHEGVNLDNTHAIVKRLGFAQMPLACVTARLVREAAKYMFLRTDRNTIPLWLVVLASTGCWMLLLLLKMSLGVYLQRTSLKKLHAAPELSQTPLKVKQK